MWHRFGGWCCNGCAKGLGVSQGLSDCRWMDPRAARTHTGCLPWPGPGLAWTGPAYLGARARLSGALNPGLNQNANTPILKSLVIT